VSDISLFFLKIMMHTEVTPACDNAAMPLTGDGLSLFSVARGSDGFGQTRLPLPTLLKQLAVAACHGLCWVSDGTLGFTSSHGVA
jgi:hypothetical protein